MGQYHIIANIDKELYIHPHKLGHGLKLWEFVPSDIGPMQALGLLLAVSNGKGGGDFGEHEGIGAWGGDRIAIVGDYAEWDDTPFLVPVAEYSNPHTYICDTYQDVSDVVCRLMSETLGLTYTGTGWRSVEKNPEVWGEVAT